MLLLRVLVGLLGLAGLSLTSAGCRREPDMPRMGPPIAVTSKTARLQVAANGQVRWPVVAFRDGIIMSSRTAGAPDAPTTYDLWDPGTGNLTPVSGWQTAPGVQERIVGSWDDWILAERFPSSVPDQFLLTLHNLGTGEIRDINMGANPGRAQIADGLVVWTTDAATGEEIHAHSVATGREDTIRLAPEFNSQGIGISANRVAWYEGKDGEPGSIVSRDLTSGATGRAPLPASIVGFAVSGDGSYLASMSDGNGGRRRLLVFDSTTQKTTRLLETRERIGELWVSGTFLIWEASPSQDVAGFYDLQRRELRLVQRRARSMMFGTWAFRNWFVWMEMPNPPPPTVPGGGYPVDPEFYYYAVRLEP